MTVTAKFIVLICCSALTIFIGDNSAYAAKSTADSAVLGIHGGDGRTRGIHGGDGRTRGIHGGDGRTRGIHGGDGRTRGIHGGDGRTRGIHGGDGRTRGIHGGDGRTRGIHGGDGRTRDASIVETSESSVGSDTSQTTSVITPLFVSVAMGPVEVVVSNSSTTGVVVLGRFFATDVTSYSVGDYVLAASSDEAGYSSVVSAIDDEYVAGVSPVLLRAPVSAVDADTARMTVGTVEVDYSALLSDTPDIQPAVGVVVEVNGIQPDLNGLILLQL